MGSRNEGDLPISRPSCLALDGIVVAWLWRRPAGPAWIGSPLACKDSSGSGTTPFPAVVPYPHAAPSLRMKWSNSGAHWSKGRMLRLRLAKTVRRRNGQCITPAARSDEVRWVGQCITPAARNDGMTVGEAVSTLPLHTCLSAAARHDIRREPYRLRVRIHSGTMEYPHSLSWPGSDFEGCFDRPQQGSAIADKSSFRSTRVVSASSARQ